MDRVKDGRITATKMTLMLLVTGQDSKHNMVLETINLAQTLYDSSNIQISE